MAKSEPEPVTAAWVRRIGDHVEMLVEIDGVWYLVAREHYDGLFSHIVEARAFKRQPDPVTA